MATGFGNKDARNWVKACLAVKCVRDGLIPLVLKYCRDHYDGNIREVRSVCKLPDYTCQQCNVEELEPFHKGKTKCKYGRCGCKVKNKKPCKKNGACGVIYDQIQAHHTTNDPNWSNTNSNLWSRSPWEQMKCYINTPGYTNRTNIDDADITALIQICLNYTPLKKLFDRNVYDMDKVRTLRNDIYHSGTMAIPNDQLKYIISQMKTFLKLSVFKDFQSDIKCQLENIRKLDNDTSEITADTEEAVRSDALRGVQESVAELISNQRLLGKQIDGLLEIGHLQKENCNSRFETINDKIRQAHFDLLDLRRQTAEDTKLQNEHMQTLHNAQLAHGAVLKDFEKNTRADHVHMFKKLEEILQLIKSDKQLSGLNLEDAPTVSDSKVTIHANGVDENVEGILSDKMLNAAKGIIQKTKVDSENEELIPPFENAISVLTKDGNKLTYLKKKCVEIDIESPTIRSWMTLCADFFNGNIERAFQPLQQCLRTHDEYKNLILEIQLDAEYFFQCMEALTDNLYEQINLQKQEIVQNESSTAVQQWHDLTDTVLSSSINDQERQIKLDTLRVTSLAVNPDGDYKTLELSQEEIFRTLLKKVKVDAMSEYPNDSFPAFCHGRAAIQAIITRGKDILDMPVFSETENKMMKSECIQIYTTSAFIGEINASNTEQMDPVKQFCLEEQNMSCPIILIVEQEKKNIIEEWIETQNDNLHGLCVLLFSKGREREQQYFSPEKGIFLNMATLSNIMAAADDILERSIFLVLEHLLEIYMEKYRPTTYFSDVETESTLQSVYAFARAAYQRSEVPECERPNIPEKTYHYPNNIDEVITTLLTIEGVVGCSKKFGRLEVSIDDTKDRKTIVEKVKLYLKNESIKATFVDGNFTYFLCPGDQVQGKKGKIGTLGGFAKRFATKTNMELNNRAETGSANQLSPVESTGYLVESTNTTVELNNRKETGSASQSIPEKSAGNLVALISRHVAHANMEMGIMHLLVNNKIIGHTDNIHPQTLLDIIPIDIYENLIGDCNTRFKTEQNKFMHAQLIDKEHISTLMGTKVHIWGAVSSPGLGTLVDIDFKMTGGLCIKVCDCINGKPFSYPGDSGAIVCASDSRGRNLYAIAMLIGKYEGIKIQPTYMAVLLSEAFQKLK